MTANHFEMFYTMFISICPDLLPGPQTNTPWQALYHSQNDCEFITTIGFNVETSHKILCHNYGMKPQSHIVTYFHHPYHEFTTTLLMHAVHLVLYYTILIQPC